MKGPGIRNSVRVLLTLNAVLIGAIFFLSSRVVMRVRTGPQTAAAAPLSAPLAPFALTRETGEPFSSDALKGSPWIASFLFTRCPYQCPVLSTRLFALQKTLPAGARIVSFTVDPTHDTPQELSTYARRFSADPARWIFLTGDPAALADVQTQLKLSNGEDPAMHSLRFVLMDGQNRARGYYDSTDPAALAKLKKDLTETKQ